jgi:hypothetical protein
VQRSWPTTLDSFSHHRAFWHDRKLSDQYRQAHRRHAEPWKSIHQHRVYHGSWDLPTPRLQFTRITVRPANCCITDADCHSWSKLLPKKGDLFDAVMQQLRSAGMKQLSAQYASLRDGIVRSRMDLLRDVGHRALVVQVSPVLNHELMSPGLVYREARQEMLGLE